MCFFVLQIMTVKIRNSEEEIFITLKDHMKVFDTLQCYSFPHVDTVKRMGFSMHLVALLNTLYEDHKAIIRWNNNHCEYFDKKKGFRPSTQSSS